MQQRRGMGQPSVLSADDREQRRFRYARRVERAHAVAQARRGMKIDDAKRSGGTGATVGHRNGGDLAERHHVLQTLAALAKTH